MTDWQELESRVFMATGRRLPVVLVRGEGTRVWDDGGKAYLDFFGGVAVTSLGHSHPVLVQAIIEQAQTMIHTSNTVYSIPQLKLAELLVENSCFDKVYFQNSGAEANEAAIKLARKWGKEKKRGAYEVITATGSFHGRTLATVTATGTSRYSAPFVPLPTGFSHVLYDDIEALEMNISDETCAIMLEPIQGEGGVIVPERGYLASVRALCDDQNILLIFDEIQTGMCRTGPLFAYEEMGCEPDVMTLAKGLGGGVPVAALLAKDHCCVFTPGDHGSTFGGNPLATAAAYAVTKYMIDNDLPAQVAKTSAYLFQQLSGLRERQPLIESVRGKGLLVGLGLRQEVAEKATLACLAQGLLVNAVRPDTVRLTPPLTVSEAEVDEAIAILETALASLG